MRLTRYLASAALMFAWALPSALAELKADRDYRVIPIPQPVASPGKIEVLEFFYYGCPHCYDLQSALKQWKGKMPRDVEFRSVPAIFRDSWVPLVKTFYALDALGLEKKLGGKVYEAIQLDNLQLSDEKVMAAWIAKQGVDRQKFLDAYNSFAMQGQIMRSRQATRDYDVQDTPTLVVDGKYATSPDMAGGPQQMIRTLDALIDKVRKERAAKPRN